MGKETLSIKMAKASKDDLRKMYLAGNILENIFHYSNDPESVTLEHFEHFEREGEQDVIRQMFEGNEIDFEKVARTIYSLFNCGSHGRVVMGCDVLIDNFADPDLDYLDFKPEILKALEAYEPDKEEKQYNWPEIELKPKWVTLVTGWPGKTTFLKHLAKLNNTFVYGWNPVSIDYLKAGELFTGGERLLLIDGFLPGKINNKILADYATKMNVHIVAATKSDPNQDYFPSGIPFTHVEIREEKEVGHG